MNVREAPKMKFPIKYSLIICLIKPAPTTWKSVALHALLLKVGDHVLIYNIGNYLDLSPKIITLELL